MGDNYVKMRDGARALFLGYDLDEIARRWRLESDGGALYAEYFGQRLRIDRRTAAITHADDPGDGYRGKDFINESMVLFDILTRSATPPRASGEWCGVSTLGGVIGAGHDRTLSHEDTAALFDGKTDALADACRRLGGVPAGKADVGFAVPLFRDFSILFQYWEADDEFPASIRYLFDANALQYMHYETLWYAMGTLADRLKYYCGIR